jgi:hypothetical protein
MGSVVPAGLRGHGVRGTRRVESGSVRRTRGVEGDGVRGSIKVVKH